MNLTSFLGERIAHQKSHADVLNASSDEYNTKKPDKRTC